MEGMQDTIPNPNMELQFGSLHFSFHGAFKISEPKCHYVESQAVQEYQQQCMGSRTVCTPGDVVLITKADLEGYDSPCNDNSGKELAVVSRRLNTSPMMAKLSCLFASLRVTGNYGPVMRQLTEARAC